MKVDFELIAEAARVLRPAIVETPLLGSPVLDALAGARILCKADNLQRTGSFKYRGAFFRLSRLSAEERARGVVAFSSGNFAQALAAAGAAAGVKVTIVMPVDAPRAKIDATRNYGAEVVLSEHGARNREEAANELAMKLAEERGLAKLHPFDDPLVVAGQASCGIEVVRQAAERGVVLDTLVVPVGGSGLIAGVALAVRRLSPATSERRRSSRATGSACGPARPPSATPCRPRPPAPCRSARRRTPSPRASASPTPRPSPACARRSRT